MDAMTAIQTCFEKYADFNGRARRSEFWWFWAALVFGSFIFTFVDDFIGTPIIGGLFTLATLVPVVAAGARRLHDTDRSGWWQAMSLPPLAIAFAVAYFAGENFVVWIAALAAVAATILQVVWMAMDTVPGDNRFGPPPK